MEKHTLEIRKTGSQFEIAGLHKGDNGFREFEFSFTDGGEPFSLPDGLTATFYALLPSKDTVFAPCTIENSKVYYSLFEDEDSSPALTSVAGRAYCEIRLTASTGEVLTSPSFTVFIEDIIQNDSAIEAKSEFSALTEALIEVQNVQSGLAGKTDKVRDAVAGHIAVFDSEGNIADGMTPPHKAFTVAFDETGDSTQVFLDTIEEMDNYVQAGYSFCVYMNVYGRLNMLPCEFVKNSAGWIIVAADHDKETLYTIKLVSGTVTYTSEELSVGGGGAGENGATFTPYVSSEGVISWTNDKGLDNPESVDIKGPQGERGLQGVAGPAGADGADGADGVSASHTWNGTILTMTSASGTSSADLKGDKGEKGDKGDTGSTGATGADGKDGIDGADGADGYTPVKGTDYFTAADKSEMVASVIAALPKYEGGVS